MAGGFGEQGKNLRFLNLFLGWRGFAPLPTRTCVNNCTAPQKNQFC